MVGGVRYAIWMAQRPTRPRRKAAAESGAGGKPTARSRGAREGSWEAACQGLRKLEVFRALEGGKC